MSPESKEVDLAEFNQLRLEINNRTDISTKLVLGQITLLSVGVSLAGASTKLEPWILTLIPVLSIFSSILWLFSLSHIYQIYKLGGYIACELAPRLRSIAGNRVLGWDEYSGDVDAETAANYEFSCPRLFYFLRKLPKKKGMNIAKYTSGLFAVPTIVLVALDLYLVHAMTLPLVYLHISGAILAGYFWLFGCYQSSLIHCAQDRIKKAVEDVAKRDFDGDK